MLHAREAGEGKNHPNHPNCFYVGWDIFENKQKDWESTPHALSPQGPGSFPRFLANCFGGNCFAFSADLGLKIALVSSSVLYAQRSWHLFASFVRSVRQLSFTPSCRPGNLWSLCLERALGLGIPTPRAGWIVLSLDISVSLNHLPWGLDWLFCVSDLQAPTTLHPCGLASLSRVLLSL